MPSSFSNNGHINPEETRLEGMKRVLESFTGGSNLARQSINLLYYLGLKFLPFEDIMLDPDEDPDAYQKAREEHMSECFSQTFIASHNDLLNNILDIAPFALANQDAFDSEEPLTVTIDELSNQEGYKDMAFYCLETQDELSRTEIAQLTRAINMNMQGKRPVILVVRFRNYLSLAMCERYAYVQTGHAGERVGKVSILKNVDCSSPHRGHLDILLALDTSKSKSYNEVYKNWLDTFSNELLTERFYKELSNWYAWAIQKVRFPNNLNSHKVDDKANAEGTIRMVTRLIFVWFLKAKGLVPDDFFDEDIIRANFIEHFEPRSRNGVFYSADNSKYYRVILQNLFFAMLNRPISNEDGSETDCRRFRRVNADYNINNVMRYEDEFLNPQKFVELANSHVPFLNGGLFDCLDDKDNGIYPDGFSDRIESIHKLFVPDYLFFGGEEGDDVDLSEFYDDQSLRHTKVRGLIEILKDYHFTVEENTPYEQEVSLDPELLGKVFENLLASVSEDTKKPARKSTGSYYTPRDVVQYMVDESLIAHLNKVIGRDKEDIFRKLIGYNDEAIDLTEEERAQIIRAVYDCKILDPACGSGAFPVGMLQQMVHVLSLLDKDNILWLELMKEEALKQSDIYSEDEEEEEKEAAIREIENNFDESKKFPDYARKLYLIEHCIHGVDIQPIAIQISKLRFFISLVVDQKRNNDPLKNFGIQPLPNLEAKFVAADSLIPLTKENDNVFVYTNDVLKVFSKMEAANHRIFKAKTNYKKRKAKDTLENLRKDLANRLLSKGYVGSTAANQIAEFNPFNQNEYAHFFDPEFMFGVKDGFDIVIGNPPYVSTKGRDDEAKKALNDVYGFADDLYNHFIFRSFNLLKDGGIQTMITSDTYFTTLTKANVRKILLDNTLLQLVHWGYYVFPAAMVSTATFIAEKARPEEGHCIRVYDMKGRKSMDTAKCYSVSYDTYKNSICGSFFIPTLLCDTIDKKFSNAHRLLSHNWADKIATSKKIEKNSRQLNTYRDSLNPGDVTLLGLITDGGVGLQTGDNGRSVGVRRGTRVAERIWSTRADKLREFNKKYRTTFSLPESELEVWSLFDKLKRQYGRDVFGKGYLYRIVPEELIADYNHLTPDEKERGISGKASYVPYDKGDKEGNRWYLETPYLIDWGKENVAALSSDPAARFQNTRFYFKEGFCYSDIKTFFLRCRLKGVSVHDVKSMTLFPLTEKVPYYYIVTLINSHLMATIVYNFLNNTPSFQINDCRNLPIIVPTKEQLLECSELFDKAINIQIAMFAGRISTEERDRQLQPVQDAIDKFVYKVYGIETSDYLTHINRPYYVTDATPLDTIHGIFSEVQGRYNPIKKELSRKIMTGELSVEGAKYMFPPKPGVPLTSKMVETGFLQYHCGVLTAFRYFYDKGENRNRNSKLRKDLNFYKEKNLLDYRLVDGYYKGVTQDSPDQEECFLIFDADPNRFSSGSNRQMDFFTILFQLSEKYDQECFLYKCAGLSREAFLVSTNSAKREADGDISDAGFLYLNPPKQDAWTVLDRGSFTFSKTPPQGNTEDDR